MKSIKTLILLLVSTSLSTLILSPSAWAESGTHFDSEACESENYVEEDPLSEVGWDVEEDVEISTWENSYSENSRASIMATSAKKNGFKVTFNRLQNFDVATKRKLAAAKKILEETIESKEFIDAVRKHSYNGYLKFADSEGLTNSGIVNAILDAEEPSSKGPDGEMNLYLTMTNLPSGVVGEAFVGGLGIKVSREKYREYSPAQIGRSLLHEWLHNMGFNHDKKATVRRAKSVPYGVGKAFEDIVRKSY